MARKIDYFQRDLIWTDAAHYSADGFLRSTRFSDRTPFTVDMPATVGVTVQAGTRFTAKRRSTGYRHDDVAVLGRAFLSEPGERFHVAIDGDCRLLQLNLPVDLFERILNEDHDETRGVAALQMRQGDADPDLLRLHARALLAPAGMRHLAIREIVARLLAAHGTQRANVRARGLSPATLRRVRDLVDAAPTEMTLSAMATEAGLSVFHFAREFHRETGQTPWNFVMLRRLWLAAELLDDRELSVAEVARRAGFTDASHLGRSFRKAIGVTPSQVRGRLLP